MSDIHVNQCVRYVKQAVGQVDSSHFALSSEPMAGCKQGEIQVRIVYLSLDPYQRRQMMPGVVYAQPLKVGDIMVGRAVGRVVQTRNPHFKEGDWVKGNFGWQQYATIPGVSAEKIELDGLPPSMFLGALGSPGMTAWVGLHAVAAIKPGETVVISAATGAVGSVAVALARTVGCRTVGIAGGQAKCEHALETLGYDACVDYRRGDFRDALLAATPAGVDVDFENVGGPIFDCVLERLNDFGRVALCGLISQYNNAEPAGLRNIDKVLNHNATIAGFRVTNYVSRYAEALVELKRLVRAGEIARTETIVEGLDRAPEAFIGLFQGKNLGKLLVRVAEDGQC